MYLPSHRFLLLLVLAAPLFLIATPLAVVTNLILVVLGVADGLRIVPAEKLVVDRRFPGSASLGDEADVHLTVENRSTRAVDLLLTDDLPPTLARIGDDRRRLRAEAGEKASFSYRVRADGRGGAIIGDVHMRVLGPWSFVWHQRREPRADRVQVQPGLLELRRYRLLAQKSRLREMGLRSMPHRGEGSSFESLREYIRGDDPRRIDWKASGRHGALIVRQMEAERSQSIVLAIDTGRMMMERLAGVEGDGRERLDHALSAALLLADVAAQHGDRVGLFVFSDRVDLLIPPARGSLKRIARALADVQPRLREPDYPGAFAHLQRHLRHRSLLVLFTDVIDHRASGALLAQLGAARRRHLPLAITIRNPALDAAAIAPANTEAAVFQRAAAEELLHARGQALAAMKRAGVLVSDTRPGDAVPEVVNRYLEVKRKALL